MPARSNHKRKEAIMLLHPPKIRTDRFTWAAEDRLFVTEASDLADADFGPVYDDAIDIGFTLVSEQTGREAVMVEHHREYDNEHDLLYTDFIPAEQLALVMRGAPPRFVVRVFND
jgi:hypothetical protein